MNDLVTIIIPAYNVEQYIQRCIQSCCEQTYKRIEIIVVNDGSQDNTWPIIQMLANNDQRVICINKNNEGVSVARNVALDASSGDWVLFLDSDDWLEKNAVESLLNHIDNEDILVCSDCYFVYGDKDVQKKDCQNNGYEDEKSTQHELMRYIGQTSKFRLGSSCYKLFNRKIIEKYKLRFVSGIHQGEDGLFTFQYICRIRGAVYFRDPLWNIYDRPGSACNSPYNEKWKTALEAINIMLEHGNNLPESVNRTLYAYKAERAMWLETNCILSPAFSEADFLLYRSELRKYGFFLIRREKKVKTIMQYFLYAILPSSWTKIIILFVKNTSNKKR